MSNGVFAGASKPARQTEPVPIPADRDKINVLHRFSVIVQGDTPMSEAAIHAMLNADLRIVGAPLTITSAECLDE